MMQQDTYRLNGRSVYTASDPRPEVILLQPADDNDLERLQNEIEMIRKQSEHQMILAVFKVHDWNIELTPWCAPAVFGNEDFGDGAENTLHEAVDVILKDLRERYDLDDHLPVIIGGYSLAGLFALWACTQTNLFKGCAAASPSVWYPGWMEYLKDHPLLADYVYLSLGDREEKTKSPVMKTVGDHIREMEQMAGSDRCILEWNKGNHFVDSDVRTGKAFAWTIYHVCKE